MLGSQALLHVLSAQRWQAVVDEVRLLVAGVYGEPPRLGRPGRPAGQWSCSATEGRRPGAAPSRLGAGGGAGLATSEEELLLIALFGDDAEPLLRTIRARARGEELAGRGVGEDTGGRVRELVDLVQESGIGEVTIEEGELGSPCGEATEPVRRSKSRDQLVPEDVGLEEPVGELPERKRPRPGRVAHGGCLLPGHRPAASPVRGCGGHGGRGTDSLPARGDEALQRGEGEIDAVVRSIHVENAQPVEYGQLLFE